MDSADLPRKHTHTHIRSRTVDMIQVNALIPALVAGNSVLLKPSPQTPLVAERIQESFEAAGIPRGLIQVRDAFFSCIELPPEDGRERGVVCLSFCCCCCWTHSMFQSLSSSADSAFWTRRCT